jgi:hypothetical protein
MTVAVLFGFFIVESSYVLSNDAILFSSEKLKESRRSGKQRP